MKLDHKRGDKIMHLLNLNLNLKVVMICWLLPKYASQMQKYFQGTDQLMLTYWSFSKDLAGLKKKKINKLTLYLNSRKSNTATSKITFESKEKSVT